MPRWQARPRLTSTTSLDSAERARLLDALRHPGASVQLVAHSVYELGRLALRGDGEVMALVLPFLKHQSPEVRREATFTVSRVAAVGDPQAVDVLLGALRDPVHAHVRQQAAEGLRWIARRGDSRVLTALLDALRDDAAAGVRRDAAHAVADVADPGDMAVAAALLARLRSGETSETFEEVRLFLMHALGCVSTVSDADTVFTLLRCLLDGEAARQVAGEALARIFSDEESLPIFASFMARVEHMERRFEKLARLPAEDPRLAGDIEQHKVSAVTASVTSKQSVPEEAEEAAPSSPSSLSSLHFIAAAVAARSSAGSLSPRRSIATRRGRSRSQWPRAVAFPRNVLH